MGVASAAGSSTLLGLPIFALPNKTLFVQSQIRVLGAKGKTKGQVLVFVEVWINYEEQTWQAARRRTRKFGEGNTKGRYGTRMAKERTKDVPKRTSSPRYALMKGKGLLRTDLS